MAHSRRQVVCFQVGRNCPVVLSTLGTGNQGLRCFGDRSMRLFPMNIFL